MKFLTWLENKELEQVKHRILNKLNELYRLLQRTDKAFYNDELFHELDDAFEDLDKFAPPTVMEFKHDITGWINKFIERIRSAPDGFFSDEFMVQKLENRIDVIIDKIQSRQESELQNNYIKYMMSFMRP